MTLNFGHFWPNNQVANKFATWLSDQTFNWAEKMTKVGLKIRPKIGILEFPVPPTI